MYIYENNYHIAVAILLLLVIIILYILVYFVKGGISMKCVKGIYLLLHRKRHRRMLRTKELSQNKMYYLNPRIT